MTVRPDPYLEVPSYAQAREAHRARAIGDAELAAAYVVERVRRAAGTRWLQGARQTPFASSSSAPLVRLFAEQRLVKIGESVARALVAWAGGERRVDLLFDVPPWTFLLERQARGVRCVSLLDGMSQVSPGRGLHEDDDALAAPHEDGLAFALHDLCHLEKFVDPAHHAGQVGFFAVVHAAVASGAWAAFARRFDATFDREVEHAVADMNGSAVFLFAALKMKLKMAARRRVARVLGRAPLTGGPLDPDETSAFAEDELDMLAVLGLRGETRDGAIAVSTKRDARDAAAVLLAYFEARGGEALAREGSAIPRVSGSVQTQDAVASEKTSGTASPPDRPYVMTP